MIKNINLLKNIGQFNYVKPPKDMVFKKYTLLHAENGRGKTTLASIFRSLADNEPSIVSDRHRLGAQNQPHIVLDHEDGPIIFENGVWSKSLPDIAIYDDDFVASNVCSGVEIQAYHKKNLHELILGARGVNLNNELKTHISNINAHNEELRKLSTKIQENLNGEYELDEFCSLERDEAIDDKIDETFRRLELAEYKDVIRLRDNFQDISLPNLDVDAIEAVLARSLDDLGVDTGERIRIHFDNLRDGGESWVAEGLIRIQPTPERMKNEVCPFCAQDIAGLALIGHYRAYFGEEYKILKRDICEAERSVLNIFSDDNLVAFLQNIQTFKENRAFWSMFIEIETIEVDSTAIASDWKNARKAALDSLRAKASAPLERMGFSANAHQTIQNYKNRISEVSRLSIRFTDYNQEIKLFKERVAAYDFSELVSKLNRLYDQQVRFDHDVGQLCERYLAEKNAKAEAEVKINEIRDELDRYQSRIFPAYASAINSYLTKFAASFRLGNVQPVNGGEEPYTSYCVSINRTNVNLNANEGPSFRNTLSAGDRNTLALAFFFSSLDQDPNRANKIVVLDDPMTSLDEHRASRTREQIQMLSTRVLQTIVLSHSKPFLCGLWENASCCTRKALRIYQAANSSQITVWDVEGDNISEHDKRHKLIRDYVNGTNPDQYREVARAIRPLLEAFLRVAFPDHFPPGTHIGRFLDICDGRIDTDDEVLSQKKINELKSLKDYANQFHHDNNLAGQGAHINEGELTNFAERALRFSSCR